MLTLWSSANARQRGWCHLDKAQKSILHHQGPRHAGLGTHHLLQLVLDLPVHLCHLEEHIPCRDRTGRV